MKNDMNLKHLLNEINKNQMRGVKKLRKYAVIDEIALTGILNSGVLPSKQSSILKEYFNSKKINRINESVIKRVDQDMKYLSEGLIDWFKKKGEQAKAAFEKGWSAVKGIWKNFSDVVKEFVIKLKEIFKKISDWALEKVKALASKLGSIVNEKFIKKFKEDHPHEHSDLKTEFGQVKETASHLKGYFTNNLENGGAFEDKIINGSVDPKEEPDDISPAEADKAAKELAQEAYGIYKEIFSKKENLKEIMNLQITESGHLTDNIKNPIVRNIIEFCVFMLKVILSPFSTVVGVVIKTIMKETMTATSKFCNALGGPGVFKFAIISLLAAEIFEVVEDLLANIFNFKNLLSVVSTAFPLLAPFIEGAHIAFHIGHLAVGTYALFTVIHNLKPLFDKAAGEEGGEEGGEPEVQTAGYKPKGSFKLKEGKLVFIQ